MANYHVTSWAMRGSETRRWAFYNVGAQMCRIQTGRPHGPVQWLQAASAPAAPRHESPRLFTPVDVMPGQTGLEL